MSSPGSVSHWVGQLQAGDAAAAQVLWDRYFPRLVALARKRLRDLPRRAADEEDVALSAFDSFCRAAEHGRFSQIADRDDLWRLLATLTARKASNLVRQERRQKRGGGTVMDESALQSTVNGGSPGAGLEHFQAQEPTPEFAAQMAEEFCRLLDKLDDARLRSIALWKLDGNTTEEIAARLGCAPSTVERRLRVIRGLWQNEGQP